MVYCCSSHDLVIHLSSFLGLWRRRLYDLDRSQKHPECACSSDERLNGLPQNVGSLMLLKMILYLPPLLEDDRIFHQIKLNSDLNAVAGLLLLRCVLRRNRCSQ